MLLWFYVQWGVVPLGLALAAMMISGKTLALAASTKLAGVTLRIWKVRLTLASSFSVFCCGLVVFSWSSLRRCEVLMEGADEVTKALAHDNHMKNIYQQERNLWISFCALFLWCVVWRLKVLHDSQQLKPPPMYHPWYTRGRHRFLYFLTGLAAFLLADIPLCRLNYNFQLRMFVTPKKAVVLANVYEVCEEAYLSTASEDCSHLCASAIELSEERLWAINWARNWHIFGRLGAQFFDDFRGVEQGQERIAALFETKTCLQVIESSDKSNNYVNMMCVGFAIASIATGLTAISNALAESYDEYQDAAYHGYSNGYKRK